MNKQILLDNKNISKPPDSIKCPFCQNELIYYIKDTARKYSCNKHLPLHIDSYCFLIKSDPNEEWFFSNMSIGIPKHFQFCWESRNNLDFYLQEWKEDSDFVKGYWDYNAGLNRKFSIDWIFSQSAERLLSILQMHKVFS